MKLYTLYTDIYVSEQCSCLHVDMCGCMDQWYVRITCHRTNQPITAWCKICDEGEEAAAAAVAGMASV